jgi:hypothetical protein
LEGKKEIGENSNSSIFPKLKTPLVIPMPLALPNLQDLRKKVAKEITLGLICLSNILKKDQGTE